MSVIIAQNNNKSIWKYAEEYDILCYSSNNRKVVTVADYRGADSSLGLARCVYCFCLLKRDFICPHACDDCDQYNGEELDEANNDND